VALATKTEAISAAVWTTSFPMKKTMQANSGHTITDHHTARPMSLTILLKRTSPMILKNWNSSERTPRLPVPEIASLEISPIPPTWIRTPWMTWRPSSVTVKTTIGHCRWRKRRRIAKEKNRR
jgi:hypothetical protein